MSLDEKQEGNKLWAFEVNNITKAIRGLKKNIIELAGGVGKIFSHVDTSQQSVVASTTETTLYSFTLDKDVLGNNSGVYLEMPFKDAQIGNGRSMTIKLKYGSTTIVSQAYNNSSTPPNLCDGMFKMYLLADDSKTAQKGIVSGIGSQNSPSFGYGSPLSHLSKLGIGTATEDSSTDLTVTITVQFSNLSASDKITTEGLIVKSI